MNRLGIPSRREAILGALATVMASDAKAAYAPPADPVLVLARLYRDVEAAGDRLDKQSRAISYRMTAEYGRLTGEQSADDLWGADPEFGELLRINRECDGFTEQLCEITDAMVATPATTLAGIAAKMQVAIELFPRETGDFYEDVALAALKDAVRLLAEEAACRA